MSKMTTPMAVFGGLALIAVSISLPTIIKTVRISEAHAEISGNELAFATTRIVKAIKEISACHNK